MIQKRCRRLFMSAFVSFAMAATALESSFAQTDELTPAEIELTARDLGTELTSIAARSTSRVSDARAEAHFDKLAEDASTRVEVLGAEIAEDRTSDAARAAYAATISAVVRLLEAADTMELDVSKAEVDAWRQSLRSLEPKPPPDGSKVSETDSF